MELKMSQPRVISSTDEASIAALCEKHSMSPAELSRLKAHAVMAKGGAYCPYSKFRVGAALLLPAEEGHEDELAFVRGVNVENASYPVGTCAERVALGNAVTAGYRSFRALGVSTDISPPASPCGMCRQFIREFVDLKFPIFMFDKNEDFIVMTLEELLPMSFGPDQLPKPGPSV